MESIVTEGAKTLRLITEQKAKKAFCFFVFVQIGYTTEMQEVYGWSDRFLTVNVSVQKENEEEKDEIGIRLYPH
ncbi:MAG: hypothetical protein RR131_03970 [Anaerovorax sp.]